MKDGEGAREIQTEAWSENREDDILKWLDLWTRFVLLKLMTRYWDFVSRKIIFWIA
jgi:hypothetical protein